LSSKEKMKLLVPCCGIVRSPWFIPLVRYFMRLFEFVTHAHTTLHPTLHPKQAILSSYFRIIKVASFDVVVYWLQQASLSIGSGILLEHRSYQDAGNAAASICQQVLAAALRQLASIGNVPICRLKTTSLIHSQYANIRMRPFIRLLQMC
jgi:hypothetical protein